MNKMLCVIAGCATALAAGDALADPQFLMAVAPNGTTATVAWVLDVTAGRIRSCNQGLDRCTDWTALKPPSGAGAPLALAAAGVGNGSSAWILDLKSGLVRFCNQAGLCPGTWH